MKTGNRLQVIVYCIFPLLLYYVVYEAAVFFLYTAAEYAAAAQGTAAVRWLSAHAGDVSAVIGALSMAAGIFVIRMTAAREAPRRRIVCPGKVKAAPADISCGVIFALSAAIFLNLVFSMSGVSAADAGAESAAAQTAAVSLPLGILYYGLLSPFIEETVFRGITYGRIRAVLCEGSAEEILRKEKEDAPGESRKCYGAAAILSSLLFGIYHGNPVQGCYAFCMGLIFCGFLEMTGSLTGTALLHGAVNVMVLILSQSGLYARLNTPAWLAAFLAVAACSGIFLGVSKSKS